ncbi:MAG: hypothetical protein Q8Q14_10255 [Gemmatimonadales bacterium]|nr:hypothetical protein [Gemmatimonadales bacterium]
MHQEEQLTEEGEEGVEDLLAGNLALALGVVALLLEGGAELDGGHEERTGLADGLEVAVHVHRVGAVSVPEHAAAPLGPFVSGWEPAGPDGRSSRRGGP